MIKYIYYTSIKWIHNLKGITKKEIFIFLKALFIIVIKEEDKIIKMILLDINHFVFAISYHHSGT